MSLRDEFTSNLCAALVRFIIIKTKKLLFQTTLTYYFDVTLFSKHDFRSNSVTKVYKVQRKFYVGNSMYFLYRRSQ